MKRLISLLLSLLLIPALTACSRHQSQPPFPTDLPRQLLESDAFSEPLEPLDAEIAWMLYCLDMNGITFEQLTAVDAHGSSGATCEEVALLTFSDETAAQTAVDTLDVYINARILSNKDYRPAEVSKLEHAVLERRGTTVLLLVANNYEAASKLLYP